MRYVASRLKQHAEEVAYRIYVTDGLKAISGNTGRSISQGTEMTKRYYDVLTTAKKPPENRTAEEIISDIKRKLSGGADG